MGRMGPNHTKYTSTLGEVSLTLTGGFMLLCNVRGPTQFWKGPYISSGHTNCHLPAGHKGSHQCRRKGGGPPICFPNGQYKEWVGFVRLEDFKPTLQDHFY